MKAAPVSVMAGSQWPDGNGEARIEEAERDQDTARIEELDAWQSSETSVTTLLLEHMWMECRQEVVHEDGL